MHFNVTKYNYQGVCAELWQGRQLSNEVDAAGNLLIRVPATGEFAKGNYPAIALQKQMDMVLVHKDGLIKDDLRKAFANGVELEVVDGWIQAKDQKTSIGADNGLGVATTLKYVLNPQLEHPLEPSIHPNSDTLSYKSPFILPIRNPKFSPMSRINMWCFGSGSLLNGHDISAGA